MSTLLHASNDICKWWFKNSKVASTSEQQQQLQQEQQQSRESRRGKRRAWREERVTAATIHISEEQKKIEKFSLSLIILVTWFFRVWNCGHNLEEEG
jgi:type II secretory pathway pseudopilin PulG